MPIPEFLSKDWQKIPQNFRFFILSGVLIISIVLANNQFGDPQQLAYLWLYRDVLFNIGILLVLVGVGLVLYKQIIFAKEIRSLRKKYPISSRDKSFYLVHFGDPIYLLDNNDKLAYHIHPLKTARDLSFNLYTHDAGMTYDEAVAADYEKGKTGDRIHFKINDYEFAGQINTTN